MDRLKYVDGLRGIFALVVVFYHSHVAFLFPAGYIAVDFFFILSGFVLSYVYLNRMDGLTFLGFAGQRFSRLWPLHMVTLVLFLVIFSVSNVLVGNDLSDPARWGNSTPGAFIKNIFLIHNLGFNVPLTWNFPSWSISVEFFVNLAMFFAFVGLVAKTNAEWVLRFIFLGVLGYFLVDIFSTLTGVGPSREAHKIKGGIFYSDLVRGFFEIFLGILIYFGVGRLKSRLQNSSLATTLLFSVLELVLFIVIFVTICTPGGDSDLIGVLSFALFLLLLSSTSTSVVKMTLSSGLLIYLGTISYALYLTHVPVFEFFRYWTEIVGTIGSSKTDTFVMSLCAMIILFGLSTFLHYKVEIPAQKYLRKLFTRIKNNPRSIQK